jgi:hypothetical protein
VGIIEDDVRQDEIVVCVALGRIVLVDGAGWEGEAQAKHIENLRAVQVERMMCVGVR